jgi:hypothetical protein
MLLYDVEGFEMMHVLPQVTTPQCSSKHVSCCSGSRSSSSCFCDSSCSTPRCSSRCGSSSCSCPGPYLHPYQ